MAKTGNYVLEVVKVITEKYGDDGWLNKKGKFEHVGYMNANSKTREDACSYYDRHNPHMRKLNAFGTYKSDWDFKTGLMYIVRDDYALIATIPPFGGQNDAPIVTIDKSANGNESLSGEWNYQK